MELWASTKANDSLSHNPNILKICPIWCEVHKKQETYLYVQQSSASNECQVCDESLENFKYNLSSTCIKSLLIFTYV
jgi:uncharacterized protein YcgL (UPF0745 family)